MRSLSPTLSLVLVIIASITGTNALFAGCGDYRPLVLDPKTSTYVSDPNTKVSTSYLKNYDIFGNPQYACQCTGGGYVLRYGGNFMAITGNTYCSACPENSYRVSASTSTNDQCNPVPTGSFAPIGATSYTSCRAGQFAGKVNGILGCNNCPSGSYAPTPASVACTPASSGFFVANSGASSQTQCPAGTYSSGLFASTSCKPCPNGWTSKAGSASSLSCNIVVVPTTTVKPVVTTKVPVTTTTTKAPVTTTLAPVTTTTKQPCPYGSRYPSQWLSPQALKLRLDLDLNACYTVCGGIGGASYMKPDFTCGDCPAGYIPNAGYTDCIFCPAGTKPDLFKRECVLIPTTSPPNTIAPTTQEVVVVRTETTQPQPPSVFDRVIQANIRGSVLFSEADSALTILQPKPLLKGVLPSYSCDAYDIPFDASLISAIDDSEFGVYDISSANCVGIDGNSLQFYYPIVPTDEFGRSDGFFYVV